MRKLVLWCAVWSAVFVCAVSAPAQASGDWIWPIVGPVIRGFDPPDSPFGSGHRGIDIAAPVGTPVRAATTGTVTFAGPVGGRLFITVDHGGGLESTYSFLDSVAVRRGDVVSRGQVMAHSGTGHAGDIVPGLHFGVKFSDIYVDPLEYLGPVEVWRFIRLAPLES